MVNKFVLVAIAALTLVACASAIHPVPFKGPNGKQAYTMRCSGKGRTVELCSRKAADLCPQGYDEIAEKTTKNTARKNAFADATPAADHLSIECK